MPSSNSNSGKSSSRISRGHNYEREAESFLESLGFELVARNWRSGHKEIDLIVRKENLLVFVEVKSARTNSYGHPAEWVDKRKMKNLLEAADLYLQSHQITNCDIRFDVITFVGDSLEHYPNAFGRPDE